MNFTHCQWQSPVAKSYPCFGHAKTKRKTKERKIFSFSPDMFTQDTQSHSNGKSCSKSLSNGKEKEKKNNVSVWPWILMRKMKLKSTITMDLKRRVCKMIITFGFLLKKKFCFVSFKTSEFFFSWLTQIRAGLTLT